MKTLPANALAEIAKKLGTQPLILVAIDWYATDSYFIYADKEISGITDNASIIGLTPITATPSGRAGQAVDLNVTLDDVDSSIKDIINANNVYHRQVIVYQFFEGLTASDKFVVFKGVIDAPIRWDENERNITLQVISEVEDQEIGVTLEETDIIETYPNEGSEPWPLAFGNVLHVPATRVQQYPVAKLMEPFCVIDQMLYAQLAALEQAWYDQQMILTFWKLVHQGAESIGTVPSNLIALYIYWVKLENYYQAFILSRKIHLGHINELKHIHADKAAADRALIGAGADLKGELDDFQTLLEPIQVQKALVEQQIKLAQYEHDLKRAAAANMIGAVNGLMNIYQTFVAAMMEICRQSQCAVLDMRVEDSDFFPQGQELILVINGLKWRGQFNDQVLSIHPTPLPRYKDVPQGARESAADDCGILEVTKGIDLFWVEDESYNLNNMYVLVKSKQRNWRHIIKIIEQDGKKCRFELTPYNQFNFQGQFTSEVVRSVTSLPSYEGTKIGELPEGWNDLFPNVNPWTELPAWVMVLLHPTWPNEEEIDFLRSLIRLARFEDTYGVVIGFPHPRDMYTIIGQDIDEIVEVSPVPLPAWFDWPIFLEEYPSEIKWKADVGNEIREDGYDHDIYVANILPSTIKAVYAYRTEDGEKILTAVPKSYYCKNEAEELKLMGPSRKRARDDGITQLTITSIRMKTPLSHIQGENWEDQIYVTMDSSVGPNTVDILEYFINTYTDKSIDTTSFDAVKAKIDNYPSSFALFDRPNVYKIINDIAMQARCVAYINNDVFYLKYLAEEPTADVTLTEANITDLTVDHGDASDIVTKLFATWRPHYLPEREKYLTLRHNVNLYGLHESDMNFFIYNVESLVLKSATFWLIRWANMWKRVSFTTFLTQLRLDLYDTVNLSLVYKHLSNFSVKSVIENLVYDSDSNTINLSCWLPVKMGEMDPYEFAWPANVDATAGFPTEIEIERGNAGGSGIGKGIITIIEGCPDV